ncbi:MAG: hypothetical protein PHX83_14510 [Acidobacteriia bacterium]|nr:hypothetical protein [Terriglobia bacterium]
MAAATLAHHAPTNYKELAEKWANKYKNMMEANKETLQGLARRGMTELVGFGVGLASGVVRGLWGDPATGDVQIEGVDVHIAAAVLINGAALAGAFGDASDGMAVAGACIGAIVADRETEKFVRQAAK